MVAGLLYSKTKVRIAPESMKNKVAEMASLLCRLKSFSFLKPFL